MDGRGRAKDNIWIERFCKTIKYEYIYIQPEENGAVLFFGIKRFIGNYNYHRRRPLSPNPQSHHRPLEANRHPPVISPCPLQNALYWGHRLLCVRIYSYLERQLVSYQVNGVSGAHGLSHLEVRNTNRTPCTVAADS